MEDVAHGAVVQDEHLGQVRLDAAQILNVRTVPERAVLSIVAPDKILAFLLQPIDDRVCVLLYRSSENDKLVPLAYLFEELVAMRSLMNIIENRMLRTNDLLRLVGSIRDSDGRVEFHLYHVP